jgi:hypothetical protein
VSFVTVSRDILVGHAPPLPDMIAMVSNLAHHAGTERDAEDEHRPRMGDQYDECEQDLERNAAMDLGFDVKWHRISLSLGEVLR